MGSARSTQHPAPPVTDPAGDLAPRVGEVRLSADSRGLRRALGPMAWAAFEEVLMGATQHSGTLVTATSVRRLADVLSVSKDTAARALNRLIAHGLLVRHPGGHNASGRFTAGGYEIRLEHVTGLAVELATSPRHAGQLRPRRAAARQAQPSLFDTSGPPS